MPEMHFEVRWPDDTTSDCYSPSTIVKDYLKAGQTYTLQEFLELSRTALNRASERVEVKYGYACSSAMDQLGRIERIAGRFADVPDPQVSVIAFRP